MSSREMTTVLAAKYIGVYIAISWRSTFWNYHLASRYLEAENYKRKIATSLHFIAIPTCTAVGCNSSQ